MNEQSYAQTTQMILAELKTALNAVDPASVEQLLAAVQQADQVFFVGVGRVMLALEAIAKRWAHLGFMVRIPVRTKYYLDDEIDSQQPMTSLFEQSLLLLGDSVAKLMIERQQLDMRSLWKYHANLE